MKNRLNRLERLASERSPRRSTLGIRVPPDDLPDDEYDTWSAEVEASAKLTGARLIKLSMGPLPRHDSTDRESVESS